MVPATTADLSVFGSPLLLGEVIGNLIDNAIRYGGQRILLEACATPDEVVLRVCDDGPALDAATLKNMFRPFWRGEHPQPDGSGLGLPIAQRLVERMHGTIRPLVGAGGAGTCVELRLPRKGNIKLALPRMTAPSR
jgi:two-component system sensor histidine kinase TctE